MWRTNILYSKLLFGSEVVTLFWFRWIPWP